MCEPSLSDVHRDSDRQTGGNLEVRLGFPSGGLSLFTSKLGTCGNHPPDSGATEPGSPVMAHGLLLCSDEIWQDEIYEASPR